MQTVVFLMKVLIEVDEALREIPKKGSALMIAEAMNNNNHKIIDK